MLVHACSPANMPGNGPRIWDNVIEDLMIDITTLSKIETLESALNSLQTSASIIAELVQDLNTIESLVHQINQETVTLASSVDNLNSLITGPIDSKLDLIENSGLSIESTINVIDTRTSSIYNLDQTISSQLDFYSTIEQSVLSTVMVIDSKILSANVSCSDLPLALALDRSIQSLVNVIDTRTSSIYSTDQTILSYVENIDQQNVTLQSAINDLNAYIANTIESQIALIENSDISIASVVNVIDTRTGSIYQLEQNSSSKIDSNIRTTLTTESLLNVINSELDTLTCISSLINLITPIDQSIFSSVMELDTRTSNIQSLTNNIFSLDQTIASQVNNIFVLDQTISSKLDTLITIDVSVQSILNDIASNIGNLACSNIAQLSALDQSITSVVQVIDTRTGAIQSNTNLIYSLDQIISSKVDVETTQDLSIQSVVNTISNNTNTIQSELDTIYSLESIIYSAVSALSCCGTSTTSSDNQIVTSLYGSEVVANRLESISVQFQYGIPTYSVTSYTEGGGTVTSANSMAVLSTAASTGSIAQVQSNNTIVYRSGHEAYAYFSVAFTGSFTATSSQFIGPIDYQNGFAVGFDGTTFGVTRRTNTVNSFTPQSSFNGDTLDGTGASGFTYNPALLNVFRIGYGYLGSSIIKFQIQDQNGNWITFHTIPFPNSSSTPSILQPYLPITARVENLTGTSVLSLRTASWNAGIIGQFNTSSYRYYQANNTITAATQNVEYFVMAIRNATVFNNVPNRIPVRIAAFGGGGIVTTSTRNVNLRLLLNATLSGTSFSNVDSGNSVMQVSTAGTYTAGTGQELLIRPMGTTSQSPTVAPIPQGVYDIILLPGQTLTITGNCTTAATTGIIGCLAWEERF
jgi:predicted transcriptional regulator